MGGDGRGRVDRFIVSVGFASFMFSVGVGTSDDGVLCDNDLEGVVGWDSKGAAIISIVAVAGVSASGLVVVVVCGCCVV